MKGADQCPRCASRRTVETTYVGKFYTGILRACVNCHTAWEPFDPADLLDTDMPLSSFLTPCNNCAFRKGSPESSDPAAFQDMLANLGWGKGRFYCHKGVPIAPDHEHGFAYPEDGKNPRKLRLCRGFLNTLNVPKAEDVNV